MEPSPPPGLHLARLTVEDAGELLTLQRAAFVTEAQTHRDPFLPPLTESLADLRAELADPAVVALGLRDGARLVGSVRVRVEADGAELRRLAIAPDHQGRGLGTWLLLAAERALPADVRTIRLFTGEHSARNLGMYVRHGYTETHRTPVGNHALVHFEKRLA